MTTLEAEAPGTGGPAQEAGEGTEVPAIADVRRPGVWRTQVLPALALVFTVLAMLAALLVGYLFAFTNLQAGRQQHLLADQFQASLALGAPRTAQGGPVAVLEIPALGLHQIVVAGTSAADLQKGPGLMPATAPPGVRGNTVIAGRRATYGRPFAHLLSLLPGQRITVVSARGTFHYKVTEVGTALPGQPDPVSPSATPVLTLVTSPPLDQPGRVFVRASLVGTPLSSPAYVITRPTTELAVTGDASALPAALLWGAVLVAVLVGTVLAYRRWSETWLIYLLTTPIILAAAVACFEQVARLLPPTY